jgi:hypothetical protein
MTTPADGSFLYRMTFSKSLERFALFLCVCAALYCVAPLGAYLMGVVTSTAGWYYLSLKQLEKTQFIRVAR